MEENPAKPFPFFLANPLPPELMDEESAAHYQAEWKWDGIRSQMICRQGQVIIWSRGEDLLTDRFPEIRDAAASLPDGTVLDGEILAWDCDRPAPFQNLQTRITRKSLTPKVLKETPVAFMAYDIMELEGEDIREWPLMERRRSLEALMRDQSPDGPLYVSPLVKAESWQGLADHREQSRELRTEGLMLKKLSSPYRSGRVKGDWWKWKVDPYTMDAVLTYAQPGSGRRAGLFTDYTFGVWRGNELITIAKAYSGLTDSEIKEVDAWIRKNTLEKFGPVRMVKPELVFELAFEGLQRSTRNKSGIAVRFPRILRWRKDKPADEADTLELVHDLLELHTQ
jgi:DNA ligase 1